MVKFQGNQFIIDGEINEKHALQIYQNECGPGYSIESSTCNMRFKGAESSQLANQLYLRFKGSRSLNLTLYMWVI